ncbi:MAG: hypothetical protein ABSE51_11740 [Terracidiphilus sp.]|jgi:hypothetical protein
MPINFGEIADYHRQEAARYNAMAQAARDRDSFGEAGYLAGLAARHSETADEQMIGMQQQPGESLAKRTSNCWSPEQQRFPFVAACLLALLRRIDSIAAAFRQPLPKRNLDVRGLSLR